MATIDDTPLYISDYFSLKISKKHKGVGVKFCGKSVELGSTSKFRGNSQNPYLCYLSMVKIDGVGFKVSIFTCEFPFPIEKGKFGCKDRRGGGGQDIYLYNVKIGNFPKILMSSLKRS